MRIVERKRLLLKIKHIFFSDQPFDVDDCDVVIFPLCRNNRDFEGFNRSKSYTAVIDLTKDLEEIWRNMDKSSCRYAIKKAERDGVEVVINRHYKEFYKIYKSFRKRKGLSRGLSRIFGLSDYSLNEIKKYGTLFIAKYNSEIICGHVYLEDDKNILYWQSARRLDTDRKLANIIGNASKLLMWEAIKYAKDKGLEIFDFGGLFPQKEAEKNSVKKGINFFKLSFGGKMIETSHYSKIYSKIYKFGSKVYSILKVHERL